jgi:hypothetical protein
MILFIGAVVGGVGLVVNIVRTDERADHGL